jgi:hypothetical protein
LEVVQNKHVATFDVCDSEFTPNPMEPNLKRFPNTNSYVLGRLSNYVFGNSWELCALEIHGNCVLWKFIWKFMGTVCFGNDHVAAILGYGDLRFGNFLITRVYYVEGLGHNLFSVGQFCDADLEVAFRRNTVFIRNLVGDDLLTGNRGTNLYAIDINQMASTSPICLMTRATETKSWLWHRRLSHLNFDTINKLAKDNIVTRLPKFKYTKEHLCPSCEQGKSKRSSYKTKTIPSSEARLHMLHMDLCGPMRVESINGKKYIIVIVYDSSRYTWVKSEVKIRSTRYHHHLSEAYPSSTSISSKDCKNR